MPIYAENEGEIPVGPITDAGGTPVADAAVTVSLLRDGAAIWSAEATTDAEGLIAGAAAMPVPHPLLDEADQEVPITVGEILVERVEIVSGTLNATYENERRVLRRRA